jgi:hypothetical protein
VRAGFGGDWGSRDFLDVTPGVYDFECSSRLRLSKEDTLLLLLCRVYGLMDASHFVLIDLI